MDSFPLSPPVESAKTRSRSSSPARSRGQNLSPQLVLSTTPNPPHLQGCRQNVSSGRKSDSLPGRGRKRSPGPVRKATGEVPVQTPSSLSSTLSQGLSGGSGAVSQHGSQSLQEETSIHGPLPSIDDDFSNYDATGNISNGSSTEFLERQIGEDVADSGSVTPDHHRIKAAIERVHQKIEATKSMISVEQKARDENVNEYLKLASNADKQQLQRIKNVFEKKNQKSAQTIAQLQKKLENYTKRIRDLEKGGYSSQHHHHRQPKEVLRDVGQGLKDVGANIRDGITGFSGGVVGNIKGGLSGLSQVTHNAADIKYTSDDDCSSVTTGSGPTAGTGTMSSPRNHPQVQAVSPSLASMGVTPATGPNPDLSLPIVPHSDVHLDLLQKFQEKQEEWQRLQDDVDTLKTQISQEISFFNSSLQEERYRYERLEEQMNDLIELHQNEIENLKQNISDMEEKLQYQSEERLRDIYEMIENCQTRISRIEHQQHEQQQLVTLEVIENSNARALVLKLINVVLTVLQVVLLLVATATNILMPFLKTRVRILTTTMLIIGILFACRQWHHLTSYLWEVFHRYRDPHGTK